ncbi:hypothetical protein CEP52_003407 [Fusarium oligoseptatum]|uniref:Zn(2)-C6 fungal-type domain-containing protein n=1 Tax=Fusarium oligoseptatum TaxID=2604345 RepID=A0A428U8W9_9HYPO|nr:hypothetical protein CEP52_003407 [Fusarium oligoseptatum]
MPPLNKCLGKVRGKMVNTGKPSRACATCKKRKIKCDLLSPACSQCIKSGWKCPGFPSEADVNFRNQTEIVQKKNKPAPSNVVSVLGARTRSVSPSTTDQATSFFIQQYVLTINGASSSVPLRGNHEYLPGLLRNETFPFGVLSTITAAAGLAALSNAGNAPAWRSEAFRMYGKAIRQLRDALQDPVERVSDQTLAAVMLMGMFEVSLVYFPVELRLTETQTISSADVSSMQSFSNHTIAAAQCIEMRGPGQFKSEASLKLFIQMRRIIVMTSHQLQEPIPYALTKWSKWAECLGIKEMDPANRFAEINEILARARAEIKYRDIKDPDTVAARLLPIDDMLNEWAQSLPPSWSYKSYRSLGPGGTPSSGYDQQYDMYYDPWVACVWNSYRNIRLLIHESIIAAALKYGTEQQKASLQSSGKVLVDMANGICHSAAYHLGHQPGDREAGGVKKFTHSDDVPSPGGWLLLWPLFFSAMLRTTPKEQRQWVAKTIRQMGLQMGLRLAMSMATMLEERELSFSHNDTFFLGTWHPN